ncbi:FR47-like protein [Mucilaginibacter gracilis]|uniref:FR47-like protein n=1 Tax=Mucilaginibacter gracilis TaxID=423350 RepID=A0A495J0M7_9SPHI|nr:GNAT family N-acetyltransferase [Mucilaginibacter gracilis]RKR81918.1 FR47-like protein [Mucilaginibacter gracilis]
MYHVLDNPAWNALVSGNKHLANGADVAKYFDKAVSPFAALKENNVANFQTIYNLIPQTGATLFVTPEQITIPAPWQVLQFIAGQQMVYNDVNEPEQVSLPLVPLTQKDVPQMLGLTKLTNPGPFAERTIEFGHYFGIFNGQQLVAMAGQRLHVFGYAEISAVCTHPDYLGRGYARQLLLHQIKRIKMAGDIPFLHVRDDNYRAIKVYQSLGFKTRRNIYFYVAKNA